VDLVLIDGPPGDSAAWARYPALAFFWPRLNQHAMLILDDAERAEEQQILAAWAAEQRGIKMHRLPLLRTPVAIYKVSP
jgi:hypothetical protein